MCPDSTYHFLFCRKFPMKIYCLYNLARSEGQDLPISRGHSGSHELEALWVVSKVTNLLAFDKRLTHLTSQPFLVELLTETKKESV